MVILVSKFTTNKVVGVVVKAVIVLEKILICAILKENSN